MACGCVACGDVGARRGGGYRLPGWRPSWLLHPRAENSDLTKEDHAWRARTRRGVGLQVNVADSEWVVQPEYTSHGSLVETTG
eukprot:COSAG02_NODE_922_length_15907_cov_4.423303_16_plen_83_part_00